MITVFELNNNKLPRFFKILSIASINVRCLRVYKLGSCNSQWTVLKGKAVYKI